MAIVFLLMIVDKIHTHSKNVGKKISFVNPSLSICKILPACITYKLKIVMMTQHTSSMSKVAFELLQL
jgi:hypothetical protein